MKYRLFSAICLIVIILILSGCRNLKNSIDVTDPIGEDPSAVVPTASESYEDALQLADGVYIQEIFSYSGEFVEDGSNDACENIAAVRIINTTDTHYQYLSFSVSTAEGDYSFSASTLFAGAVMTVLNDAKAAFSTDQIVSSHIITIAPFLEPPTVHLDTLQISYLDSFINVTNLTDTSFDNVFIYYKNVEPDGSYLGGITYRCSFGTVEGGATVQNNAPSFHQDSSRIVFATYDG